MLKLLLFSALFAVPDAGAAPWAAVQPETAVWHVITVLPTARMSPVSFAVKRVEKARSAAWALGTSAQRTTRMSAARPASLARGEPRIMRRFSTSVFVDRVTPEDRPDRRAG